MDEPTCEVERKTAGQDFVCDHAERIDIGTRIYLRRVAGGLLGRHVGNCPDDLADIGLECRDRDIGFGELCDAEVKYLGLSAQLGLIINTELRDENIGGLEIAMDDAVLVRVLDGRGNLCDEFELVSRAELVVFGVLGDGQTIDVFHRKEWLPLVDSRFINLCDAWVAELAECLGFELKPPEQAVGWKPGFENFKRHLP